MSTASSVFAGLGGSRRTIPIFERFAPDDIRARADARLDNILAAHPWLTDGLEQEVQALAASQGSRQRVYQQLRRIAHRISDAISTDTACRGEGCSACCHISVVVGDVEAEAIGEAVRVKPSMKAAKRQPEDVAEHFGSPCTFLQDGRCSIYDSRPIACMLHHSLGADPSMCSVSIDPAESFVPTVDLRAFWIACALVTYRRGWADLRSYFPSGCSGGAQRRK